MGLGEGLCISKDMELQHRAGQLAALLLPQISTGFFPLHCDFDLWRGWEKLSVSPRVPLGETQLSPDQG